MTIKLELNESFYEFYFFTYPTGNDIYNNFKSFFAIAKCTLKEKKLLIHEVVAHHISANIGDRIKWFQNEGNIIQKSSDLVIFIYMNNNFQDDEIQQQVQNEFLKMPFDNY